MTKRLFFNKLSEFLGDIAIECEIFLDNEFVKGYDFTLGQDFKLIFVASGYNQRNNTFDNGEFKLAKILMKDLVGKWVDVGNFNALKNLLSNGVDGLDSKTSQWIYYGGTKICINLLNKRRMFKICYKKFPTFFGYAELKKHNIEIPKTLDDAIDAIKKIASLRPYDNIRASFDRLRGEGKLPPEIEGVEDFDVFNPTKEEIEDFLLRDLSLDDAK